MRNCDTCDNFVKYPFNDGRKGICNYTDYNIGQMKNHKPCKYYVRKPFKRIKFKLEQNEKC